MTNASSSEIPSIIYIYIIFVEISTIIVKVTVDLKLISSG